EGVRDVEGRRSRETRQRVLMVGGVGVLAGVIGVLGASPARSERPGPEKGSLPGFPENQILADALATELGQASGLAPVAGTNGQIKDLPPVSGGVMAVLHAAYGSSTTAIRASGPSRGERDDGGETSFAVPPSRLGSQGCPNVFKREGR